MACTLISQMMIPWWCFHVAAGPVVDPLVDPPSPARLIGSDGRVHVYRRRVQAAEVMEENPRHLICRSDSFFIGRKLPPLSPSDELKPGDSYFLLPTHFFQSVLSFVTVAASLAAVNNTHHKGAPILRPFDIHKTAAGALQIRVSDDYFTVEEKAGNRGRVCDTAELEKDYKQLVSKQWKPKLETIREYSERGRSRWSNSGTVMISFRGFKRR